MIIVSVTLHSAVTGLKTELARMHISNDGTGNREIGHFDVLTLRGRDTAALDRHIAERAAYIQNYSRQDEHIWNLVARSLRAMGYR
jgi:hypothetical protein